MSPWLGRLGNHLLRVSTLNKLSLRQTDRPTLLSYPIYPPTLPPTFLPPTLTTSLPPLHLPPTYPPPPATSVRGEREVGERWVLVVSSPLTFLLHYLIVPASSPFLSSKLGTAVVSHVHLPASPLLSPLAFCAVRRKSKTQQNSYIDYLCELHLSSF